MRYLKQSTQVVQMIGPFLDKTDGVTEEAGLAGTGTEISKEPGAAFGAGPVLGTYDSDGWYPITLTTTHTNTIGALVVKVHDAATHLPVWHEFVVLVANVYDSLFGAGTDKLDVNVEEWNTTAVPAEHTAGYPIVTVKDGTGTGEINTNAGAIALVDLVTLATTTTTLTNLPAITANWLTAAGTATDFGTELATAIWTDTTAGDFTVALSVGKSVMNGVTLGTGLTVARCTLTDTLTTYTGNTVQTGDSFARIGAAGVGLTSVALADATSDAIIADAIWNAATATYGSAGSYGLLIETDLDATISSRLATASYTAPSNLTAAQIATGVWQDATAGDFTTASSIGKALYIANIAPGASGGHFISGSNAGTTTFGALTVTGATTFTGAVTGTNASNDLRVNTTLWGGTAVASAVVNANVASWAGDNVPASSIPGYPNVDLSHINGFAVASTGSTTFPTATLASTTNITAGTVTTATNVTTVNGLAANVITATSIAANAITAAKIATDAIGAAQLAADAIIEIRSLASGTSDSGSTTTMVDAARTEADTDYWKGSIIAFTSGNIAGQSRLITGFTPGTDTITFAPATTQAVTTQTYEIWPQGAVDVQQWLQTTVNTPTVAGVPNVNAKTWNDLTTVELPLVPTTAGRKLDVSAGGEAGVDWANVGTPGSTVSLSATTVATVTSVTGAVGSVTGAVGSVTGNVGGNVVGSVASVTGAVGSVTAAVAITSNIKQNQALASFEFMMTDSTNHAPATGKTVTVTRSIDGGAFAAGTLSSVTELSNGIYKVDFAAADLNGKVITLRATATSCDDTFERLVTQV